MFINKSSIGQNEKHLKWIFVKGHMKSGPSNMVLICSIYETRSNRKQSKMFIMNLKITKKIKMDFHKRPHEIRSIKYCPGMLRLLNTVQLETIT